MRGYLDRLKFAVAPPHPPLRGDLSPQAGRGEVTSRLNIPGFAFALFLIGIDALGFMLAGQLTIDSAAAMGPGYVPRGLAIIIMVYGAVMGARALFAGGWQAFPKVELRPLILISLVVALFAILLPLAGLAITSVVVVLCAGLASYEARLGENAIFAIALATFAVLLFAMGLGLPIRVWPW